MEAVVFVAAGVGSEVEPGHVLAVRASVLLRLATAAMQVSSTRDKLTALAEAAVPELSDVCAVNILDRPLPAGAEPPGPVRTLRTSAPSAVGVLGPISGQRSVWCHGDPLSAAVAAGGPVVVRYDPDDPPGWAAAAGVENAIRTGRVHCTCMVPVVVDGQVHAVIAFGAGPGRPAYGAEQRELFRLIATQAGVAMEQGERYDLARETALTLQRAMLSAPPVVAGVDIRLRYRPAGEGIEIGGDWYDVFRPAGDDLAVVVGDVAGHDIEAAAVMGQLRSMVRGFAVHAGPEPGAVLAAVDTVMRRLRIAPFATGVYLRLVPADGGAGTDLQWSNAGHPAPIVVTADGAAVALDDPRDPALGVADGIVRRSGRTVLPPGSTVLLFSDGLFERRGRDLDACFREVLRTASELNDRPLDELCDALVGAAPHDDDLVLVALRTRP